MKLHRNEKYVKWGLTALAVIVAGALFWIIFSNLRGFYGLILDFLEIISALLYGCLFAYLMNPVMKRVQGWMDKLLSKRNISERAAKRASKTVGIVVAVLVLLAAMYAIVALIVPNLIESLRQLLSAEQLQSYYDTASKWLENLIADTDFERWLNQNVGSALELVMEELKKIDLTSILSGLTSSVYNVVLAVFNILLGIVAAVYILVFKDKLKAQSKKLTVAVFNADHANRLFELARRTDRIFGGYLIGKIIDAVIVGVITYIGMLIMGMPYAPLIATIVGVTNVIPFFGPLLGMIPSALLLLIDDPLNALYFVIFILILQQIDGNIIENRILGEKLGISDLWVLVAILIFGGVFGFAGMLLGVPIFAVLYMLISDGVNKRLKKKRYPVETEAYYSIRTVEELPSEPSPSYSFVSVEPAYDMEIEADEDFEIEELDYDE